MTGARKPTSRNIVLTGLAVLALTVFITVIPASSVTLEQQLVARIPRPALTTAIPNRGIQLIGHRGAVLTAPENTLPAFDQAIEAGFDIIEIDVRSTRDGVPVVFHDKTVDRTTNGTGALEEYSWDELRQLDAGSWFDPAYAGTRVPSLEETLAHLQGRICLMWDTKGMPTVEMVRLFKKYGFDRDCLLVTYGGMGSLEPARNGEELLRLWPDAPTMTVARSVEEMDTLVSEMPQLRAVFVRRDRVMPTMVRAAHERGLLVFNSTLNQLDTEEFYAMAVDSGVDFLMLDNIEKFEAYLRATTSN